MHIVVIADMNSEISSSVISLLKERDIRVSFVAINGSQQNGIQNDWNLKENSDEEIKQLLGSIVDKEGDIDGFLSFSPRKDSNRIENHGKMIFFFAKHLSRYFHRSVHPSRKAFVVATTMDGTFGLKQGREWNPVDGALAGLVKTLHQEWPWVFTRIVDLSPELPVDIAVSSILAEWSDADSRQFEVGISLDGRYSIVFEEIPEDIGKELR